MASFEIGTANPGVIGILSEELVRHAMERMQEYDGLLEPGDVHVTLANVVANLTAGPILRAAGRQPREDMPGMAITNLAMLSGTLSVHLRRMLGMTMQAMGRDLTGDEREYFHAVTGEDWQGMDAEAEKGGAV